jgi:hypothetical protein
MKMKTYKEKYSYARKRGLTHKQSIQFARLYGTEIPEPRERRKKQIGLGLLRGM